MTSRPFLNLITAVAAFTTKSRGTQAAHHSTIFASQDSLAWAKRHSDTKGLNHLDVAVIAYNAVALACPPYEVRDWIQVYRQSDRRTTGDSAAHAVCSMPQIMPLGLLRMTPYSSPLTETVGRFVAGGTVVVVVTVVVVLGISVAVVVLLSIGLHSSARSRATKSRRTECK